MNQTWVVIFPAVVVLLCLTLTPIQRCNGAYLLTPTSFYWSWQKSVKNHQSSKQRPTSKSRTTPPNKSLVTTLQEKEQSIGAGNYDQQDMTSMLKQDGGNQASKQKPKATSYYSLSIPKMLARKRPPFIDLLDIFDAGNFKTRRNSVPEGLDYSTTESSDGRSSEGSYSTLQSTKKILDRNGGRRQKTVKTQSRKPSRSSRSRKKPKHHLGFGPWRGKRSVTSRPYHKDSNYHDFSNPYYSKTVSKLSGRENSRISKFEEQDELSSGYEKSKKLFEVWKPENFDNNNNMMDGDNVTRSKLNGADFHFLNISKGGNSTSGELFTNAGDENSQHLYAETLVNHLGRMINKSSNVSQLQVLKMEMDRVITHLVKGVNRPNSIAGAKHENRVVPSKDGDAKVETDADLKENAGDISKNMKLNEKKEMAKYENAKNINRNINLRKHKEKYRAISKSKDGDHGHRLLCKSRGRFHFLLFDEEKKKAQKRLNFWKKKIKMWGRTHLSHLIRNKSKLGLSHTSSRKSAVPSLDMDRDKFKFL